MSQGWWTDQAGTAHEDCKLLFASTSEFVPFDPGAHPEMRWPRKGWAFFCQECGDVWERIAQIGHDGRPKAFDILSVACARHRDAWNVPGSVLAGELEGLLPLLPEQMLRREFEVHAANYEREYLEQRSSSTGGKPAAHGG